MSLLLYAGLLYLLGISIVLMIKPTLMFSEKGVWKEFGIGRPSSTYTWLPFWLFSIIWAILSYLLVLVVAGPTSLAREHAPTDLHVVTETLEPEDVSTSRPKGSSKKKIIDSSEMKAGYYMLDTSETIKHGVPKYVYVGPEAPHMIYHPMDTSAEE